MGLRLTKQQTYKQRNLVEQNYFLLTGNLIPIQFVKKLQARYGQTACCGSDATLHILQAVAHILKIYINMFLPLRQSLLNFSLFSDFFTKI